MYFAGFADLWDKGELYTFIPEENYEAVAEILKWVDKMHREHENNDLELEI